jgi:hypothetical protein
LSFQQLIDASAPLRFSIAKRRALSAASRSFRATRSRATAFQLATGVLCHQRAMYVCVGVRVALFTSPSAFTSRKSAV